MIFEAINHKQIRLLMCFLLIVLLLFGCEDSDTPATPEPSFLFVQEAQWGAIEDNFDGTYTLTLNEVKDHTIYFSNRPATIAGMLETDDFIDKFDWEPPPNAAFVLTDAENFEDTLLAQLASPVYDQEAQTLAYRITPLDDYKDDPLGDFVEVSDSFIPYTFKAASVYIDSGSQIISNNKVSKTAINESFELTLSNYTGTHALRYKSVDVTEGSVYYADLSTSRWDDGNTKELFPLLVFHDTGDRFHAEWWTKFTVYFSDITYPDSCGGEDCSFEVEVRLRMRLLFPPLYPPADDYTMTITVDQDRPYTAETFDIKNAGCFLIIGQGIECKVHVELQ